MSKLCTRRSLAKEAITRILLRLSHAIRKQGIGRAMFFSKLPIDRKNIIFLSRDKRRIRRIRRTSVVVRHVDGRNSIFEAASLEMERWQERRPSIFCLRAFIRRDYVLAMTFS